MALPAHVRTQISVEEYYLLESQSEERHDWYRGEMFNMSGGTTNHSRIKINLARELGAQLKGKPCEALDSDQRLSIPPTGLRTYPDASVYCGSIEYDPNDAQRHTALNPTAVFEVLSDATEAYDRGLKADAYRQIPSLRAHVLISQPTRPARGSLGTKRRGRRLAIPRSPWPRRCDPDLRHRLDVAAGGDLGPGRVQEGRTLIRRPARPASPA